MHPREWGRRIALGWWDACRLASLVGLLLCLSLSVFRAYHLISFWPHPGNDLWTELSRALLMGLRFDAKAAAVAAFVLWPLLCLPLGFRRVVVTLWAGLFALLAVTNYFYYRFYKIPIDSVIFGLFDDDTVSVLLTIVRDFPLLHIAVLLAVTATCMIWPARWCLQRLQPAHSGRLHPLAAIGLSVLSLLMWVIIGKGTLKGMALQLDNVTATSKPFLNHAIPNGVMSLYFAWNAYKDSVDVGDDRTGLRMQGFEHPQQALRVLGGPDTDDETAIAQWMRQAGNGRPTGKNLVFVQMESWSAEPMHYQSDRLDVMGALHKTLPEAWHFSNFDAAHIGTHPALEVILFGTPITPITTGKYRSVVLDWSLAHVFKRAGYDTLFVTSGHSGWRELNRVLPTQGFDQVVDAAGLRARYPNAGSGLWGVWDEYLFRYIQERLHDPAQRRPLFVFAMPTTNHPPYELPASYRAPNYRIENWPGERSDESLVANLKTYRYANDQLAELVQAVAAGPQARRTLIAATGDHNVRTMGLYATAERRPLRHRVPFMVWGGGALDCPEAQRAPASHLDMFPTLFPLLGLEHGYLRTGRNLANCTQTPSPGANNGELSLTVLGQVRTPSAIWDTGRAASLGCVSPASQLGVATDAAAAGTCDWSDTLDQQARARLGLLDWHMRRHLNQAMQAAPLR